MTAIITAVATPTTAQGNAATTIAATIPATAGVGDIAIATVSCGSTTTAGTITPPAGWTLIQSTTAGSNPGLRSNTYWRLVATGEPGTSQNWTFVGDASLVIESYSGVDPVNPIDAFTVATATGATTLSAPTVTTTVANDLIVRHFCAQTAAGNPNITAPATQRGITSASIVRNQTALTDDVIGEPGVSASPNATGNSACWIARSIALRPAESVGSATGTATSNQRKIDVCQNGNRVMVFADTLNNGVVKCSTDSGVTWTTATAAIAGFGNGSIFVDLDDVLTVIWRQNGAIAGRSDGYLYLMRGTPNAARTFWTWSAVTTVYSSNAGNYPDLIVHREGTGWKVHLVFSYTSGATDYRFYGRLDVTSGGVVSWDKDPGAGASLANGDSNNYGVGVSHWPSIDFNHTGDGKTVAGGTPHLYLGWSVGATGAGKGIRFRKATYAAGVWTWGTEREIDNTIYIDNGTYRWLNCLFDGTRVIIGGSLLAAGSIVYTRTWDRDVADTTTTLRVDVNSVDSTTQGDNLPEDGSLTYDSLGNVYLCGRYYGAAVGDTTYRIGYRKWTRSGATLGSLVVTDSFANTGGGIALSVKRGYSNSKVEWVYTSGNNSPYSIKYDYLALSQTYTGAVNLNAPGSLSSAGTPTRMAAAALNAPGNLATAGTRTTTAAVALNAPGNLAPAGTRTTTGAVALNAPGNITAFTATLASAALNAPGNLTTAGTRTAVVGASLAAPGSLVADATRTTTGAVSLLGPGSLSTTGTRIALVGASLNAPGLLTSSQTDRTTFGAVNLNAAGKLDTTVTNRTTFGAAALNAPGNLADQPQVGQFASVALIGRGNLAVAATRTTFGAVSLTGPGALTSSPFAIRIAGAILSAPGNLISSALKYRVYVRSPISGLMRPSKVHVRRRGTDPWIIPTVKVREVGTDPVWMIEQESYI